MKVQDCCQNSTSFAAIPFCEDGNDTIPEISILLSSFLPSKHNGAVRVQVGRLWSVCNNDQYIYYLPLVHSPRGASISPNQLVRFVSFLELKDFSSLEDVSHHFEDPYFMETSGATSSTPTLAIADCLFSCEESDLVGHHLWLAHVIHGAKRGLFKHCHCGFCIGCSYYSWSS